MQLHIQLMEVQLKKINVTDDLESGEPLFAHLVYLYEDDKGKVKAKYYDEMSSLGLFDMTLSK